MGQAEGVAEFMDRCPEKKFPVEALYQPKLGTDLARGGVVIDHGPTAVARIAGTGKVVEAGRARAQVNEDPPDVTFPGHPVLAGAFSMT